MKHDVVELIERARNDDSPMDRRHAAFTELVHRYEESAFGWSLQMLEDPEEAKDATQDAFLAAWLRLRQLREPAAFGAWLKRLVATQCSRRRRKRRRVTLPSPGESGTLRLERHEQQRFLAAAMSHLPERDYRVVVLFYFLGRRIDEIASILGIARGTVGKRLHAARTAIRRHLPRAVRDELVRVRPAPEGWFDDYVGEYRFDERPDLIVRIERDGDELVSYGGGQRTVLASIRDHTLISTAFDGEARFQRDRNGRVVQLVYYEFGTRLGVARKIGLSSRA